MYSLKQSTAITIPVFGHDVSGDAVTGMVDGGFTKRISKNGGAFGAMTVTITEMENGWYSVPLGTGHTDTLGVLTITLTNASCKQINLQFRVHDTIFEDIPTAVEIQAEMEENGASILDSISDLLPATTMAAATDIPTTAEIQTEMEENGASILDTLQDRLIGTIAAGTHNPQSGDAYSRLGAPIGASISADIQTVDGVADSILSDTGTDGVVIADGGITAAKFGAGAIDANALNADAVDEIWDEVIEGTYTGRQYMRGFAAVLFGKTNGAPSTTLNIRDTGDTKNRAVATVDGDGNRTAVTLTLT